MAEPVEIARVGGGGALIVAGIGLLKWFADQWIKARRTPEQKASDAADLDAKSVQTAGDLMDGMRTDLDALRAEIRAMRRAHRAEMTAALLREKAAAEREAACERRVDALAGEVRKLQASNGALNRLIAQLKDPAATNIGGPIEGAIFELAGGAVTDVSGRPTIEKDKP